MKNNALFGFTNEYSSTPFFDDIDNFTSDNESEYLCPYALESDWIEAKGIVSHKLDKFMDMPNKFKKFDPEICHPDVQNRLHWGDPLHRHPHWEGYRKVHNIIFGIIRKNSTKHVNDIAELIKDRIEFKTNAVYQSSAKYVIHTLREPQSENGWNIFPYEITECGHLYIRDNPVKYFFPYNAYEEYKTETLDRIRGSLSHYKGVSVFVNDDFESLVIVNHKSGKRKNKQKIYMKSMFEMFEKKDQNEWIIEIRNLIIGK